MTLRQEAYAMIDSLPDDESLSFFIEMIRRFNLVVKKEGHLPEQQSGILEKRQAFLHMEELKKKYPFPKDYDYEEVRKENMERRYGCIN